MTHIKKAQTDRERMELITEELDAVVDRHPRPNDPIGIEARQYVSDIHYLVEQEVLEDKRVNWDKVALYFDCKLNGLWGRE